MITMKELLGGKYQYDNLTMETRRNLDELLERVNKVRKAWAKPMTVTSGLRSIEDHMRIYAAKGITDIKKIPMSSRHLTGRAVDIADPKRELQAWCKANEKCLEEAELWMEDFTATPTWCHFQTVAPLSGKRWFLP